MNKFLMVFPVPHPMNTQVCRLMDSITRRTGIHPPHLKLAPYATFHRPLVGSDEEFLRDRVYTATLRMRQAGIIVNGLYPLGKQNIILPALQTRGSAALWEGIQYFLSQLPEQWDGVQNSDNMLHIPVAADVASVFDLVWPEIQRMNFIKIIPLREVALCRKPVEGGRWERIASFPIPA